MTSSAAVFHHFHAPIWTLKAPKYDTRLTFDSTPRGPLCWQHIKILQYTNVSAQQFPPLRNPLAHVWHTLVFPRQHLSKCHAALLLFFLPLWSIPHTAPHIHEPRGICQCKHLLSMLRSKSATRSSEWRPLCQINNGACLLNGGRRIGERWRQAVVIRVSVHSEYCISSVLCKQRGWYSW